MDSTYFTICAGVFGLLIGSFLNVVIYRLPMMLKTSWKEECCEFLNKPTRKKKMFNLFFPRSHCIHCKKIILWYQNIPVISYLLLKGKCKNCGKFISWRYPFVELLSGIISAYIAYYLGYSIDAITILFFSYAMIALIFIDIDHQILPDNITLPLIWIGLLLNTQHIFATPQDAIIGAVCGYMSLWILAKIFMLIRKVEGMGYGDFKLFAVFGAWFGWQTLPLTITVAALFGSIIGIILVLTKKQSFENPIPFGPFIAIAGWLMIFWGNQLIHWYIHV